jgi:mannose-1-phosphate guanylyltransferase/mannose-6-phosphate isomerase
LSLVGRETLFQQAIIRTQAIEHRDMVTAQPLVVAAEENRFLVVEQLREMKIKSATMVLEPVARNTAPALTLAALCAMDDEQDPVLVVTPADHHIPETSLFADCIRHAVEHAIQGHIVTIGIKPTHPGIGFGYIQGADVATDALVSARDVVKFIEKPSLEKARTFLEQGYLWNSGIFVLRASVWLSAVKRFQNDIFETSKIAWDGRSIDDFVGGHFVRPEAQAFKEVPADSIDYAIIEKCPTTEFTVKALEFSGAWSDLGAWDAVWENATHDDHGNAFKGRVMQNNSQGNLVYSSHRLVSVVGVDDMVVVETPDAVLVSSRQAVQNVKHLVQQLQAQGYHEAFEHRKVHRPWGWYDILEEGKGFKVKRIHVNPGSSLSLQKHHHRAEHWIIVSGTAEVTNGDKVMFLGENQSTYIPLGEVHRLANPGQTALDMIEVQSGSYLGEDDIVRFDDKYGR